MILAVFAFAGLIVDDDAILRRLLAFFELIRCPPKDRLYLTLPVAVTLTLFFKPL